MSYAAVIVILLAVGAIAGMLAWFTRTRFRMEALRRHHEIGSAVFLQLGVIFAVLLAFVFNEVWSEYNTAASAINSECSNLRAAVVLASALPPPEAERVGQATAAYLSAVIRSEWASMEERHRSQEAASRFADLVLQVAGFAQRDASNSGTRSQVMASLAQAYLHRQTRLFEMNQAVPALFWVLLIGFAAALVGILLCFGIENVGAQVAFTAIFAVAIAFVLLLVRLLDLPFQGALHLTPADFESTLSSVLSLTRSAPH